MAKSSPELPPLSQSQAEIMEVIWEYGEVSASQVRQHLADRKRDVARNTVRTLLERMEEKGWLTHRVDGRTYLYSATHAKEATAGGRVLEVLDELCGGSPEALMTALIDYRGLSSSELERIRAMLDEAKPTKKSTKRGGKR